MKNAVKILILALCLILSVSVFASCESRGGEPNAIGASTTESITTTEPITTLDSNTIAGPVDGNFVDFNVTSENRVQIGYTGAFGENLVIPTTFEKDGVWYRVTSIGEYAFYECRKLTSVYYA